MAWNFRASRTTTEPSRSSSPKPAASRFTYAFGSLIAILRRVSVKIFCSQQPKVAAAPPQLLRSINILRPPFIGRKVMVLKYRGPP